MGITNKKRKKLKETREKQKENKEEKKNPNLFFYSLSYKEKKQPKNGKKEELYCLYMNE